MYIKKKTIDFERSMCKNVSKTITFKTTPKSSKRIKAPSLIERS